MEEYNLYETWLRPNEIVVSINENCQKYDQIIKHVRNKFKHKRIRTNKYYNEDSYSE